MLLLLLLPLHFDTFLFGDKLLSNINDVGLYFYYYYFKKTFMGSLFFNKNYF
jgi:hypothetical protein